MEKYELTKETKTLADGTVMHRISVPALKELDARGRSAMRKRGG